MHTIERRKQRNKTKKKLKHQFQLKLENGTVSLTNLSSLFKYLEYQELMLMIWVLYGSLKRLTDKL